MPAMMNPTMAAVMNRAVTADMAETTHMTFAGVADADMADADVTAAVMARADVTGAGVPDADVTGADVPAAGMAHSDMAGADVPAANMAAANMTANVATADVTTADMTAANMAATGMAATNMTAPAVTTAMTTAMTTTVTAAVLGQGGRTAQANYHNGNHREQSQPWDDSRAHVRPLIIGPGQGRSTAVAGVSRMLGTVQRPIFPSCVGNGSCSSNGVWFQYSAYLPVVACVNRLESLRAGWVCKGV